MKDLELKHFSLTVGEWFGENQFKQMLTVLNHYEAKEFYNSTMIINKQDLDNIIDMFGLDSMFDLQVELSISKKQDLKWILNILNENYSKK